MKAVFPKNIQKGLLAGLTLTVGPISVSIVQIFILALGVAAAFFAFNQFQKVNRVIGGVSAVFVFLIFLIIAFFKISEMNLLEFIVKFITGTGKAEKLLVQKTIMKLFRLQEMPEYNDAADALGLAYLANRF